jgi:hypothetical protein
MGIPMHRVELEERERGSEDPFWALEECMGKVRS